MYIIYQKEGLYNVVDEKYEEVAQSKKRIEVICKELFFLVDAVKRLSEPEIFSYV